MCQESSKELTAEKAKTNGLSSILSALGWKQLDKNLRKIYCDRLVTMESKVEAKQTFLNLSLNKQQRIIEVAIDEFSQKGYQQASINKIVSRLGIAKGSIYQYFDNKKGLFLYIFNYAVKMVGKTLKRVKKESENEPVFERLRQSLLAGIAFTKNHPNIYQTYLKILFESDVPFKNELIQSIRFFSLKYLMPLLKTGMERGEIRKDLDLNMMAFMLDAMMDRFLQAHHLPFIDSHLGIFQCSQEEVERLVNVWVDTLKRGLSA